jgi:uncharacterized protein (UPF0261 family)
MISCGPLQRKDNNDPLWVSRNIATRKYYVQDAYRVQARMNAEELKFVAKVMGEKLNGAKGPVRVLIPLKGWSSLSVQGQALYDPDADRAFVEELKRILRPEIGVSELELPLNSPEFAAAIAAAFDEMMQAKKTA